MAVAAAGTAVEYMQIAMETAVAAAAAAAGSDGRKEEGTDPRTALILGGHHVERGRGRE